jgi:uncharacterized protein with GYD domain
MSKYLLAANYQKQGMDGVRSEGAKSRVDSVRSTIESLGGKLESFHFAFGDVDAYLVVDLPDDEAAAAMAMTVNGSGAVTVSTTKLLTAEQIDSAIGHTISYRPPGG